MYVCAGRRRRRGASSHVSQLWTQSQCESHCAASPQLLAFSSSCCVAAHLCCVSTGHTHEHYVWDVLHRHRNVPRSCWWWHPGVSTMDKADTRVLFSNPDSCNTLNKVEWDVQTPDFILKSRPDQPHHNVQTQRNPAWYVAVIVIIMFEGFFHSTLLSLLWWFVCFFNIHPAPLGGTAPPDWERPVWDLDKLAETTWCMKQFSSKCRTAFDDSSH